MVIPTDTADRPVSKLGVVDRWVSLLFLWAPAVIVTLHLKYRRLRNSWDPVLAFLRLTAGPDSEPTLLQTLSLMRGDLLVAAGVVPLLLLLFASLPRWFRISRILLAIVVSVFGIFILVERQALAITGQFISLDLILDGIWWGLHHPADRHQYFPIRAFIKLVGFLATVAAAALAGNVLSRYPSSGWTKFLVRSSLVSLGGLLLVSLGGWLSSLPTTPYHRSLYSLLVAEVLTHGRESMRDVAKLPVSDLRQNYRAAAALTDPTHKMNQYWGKAAGFNLFIFVMETAPASCAPSEGALENRPNFEWLRNRALIGLAHHTTSPYSSKAGFSMFTGMYPPEKFGDYEDPSSPSVFPGFMWSLAQVGYETAFYMLSGSAFPWERGIYAKAGIKRFQVGGRAVSFAKSTREQRIHEEDQMMASVIGDLKRWGNAGKRFACFYWPQIGHAPWLDIKGDGEPNVQTRGEQLVEYQDTLLGRILETLRGTGSIEHTIIIVTGDHGVRYRAEDPRLPGGVVDDYTFHVPFLLFVPGALKGTQPIPALTSHIDISPTLLDLFGIENGRAFEQGLPIWDPRVANRRVYFWADPLIGVSGYHYQDEFAMRIRLDRSAFLSRSMHFEGASTIPPDSSKGKMVNGTIDRMLLLKDALIQRASSGSNW